MSCCGASSITGSTAARAPTLLVEFLFLDDSICRPCTETADALEEAIEIAAAPLAAMGVGMRVEKVHVGDEAAAKAHQLLISPTIRINGADIDPARTQGECDTCGDLAGGTTTINYRRWHWRGAVHRSAPTGKLVEAIMDAATRRTNECCAGAPDEDAYIMPENLQAFFDARERGQKSCC